MNKRRKLVLAIGASALAAPFASFAQPQGKVWRVGFLAGGARPLSIEASVYGGFTKGMRELGYIEGKNFAMEWRFAEGKYEHFPELTSELVRAKVDVIVSSASAAINSIKKTTSTIPIVFAPSNVDPVAAGHVASLARPGGNITGLASLNSDLSPKQLELLRTAASKVAHVAIMVNPDNPSYAVIVKNAQVAGEKLGIKILAVEARTPGDIARGFATITRERAQALIVPNEAVFFVQQRQIAALALKHKLLSIFGNREYVEAGGLMSYGQPLNEFLRRAATYVDKIFKGANPGDLPVEQPTIFELFINGKTAKALGLTIPQSLLISADKVIE